MKSILSHFTFILVCGLCLIGTGCGMPGPDDVVSTCLRRLDDKNYDAVLTYCGPRFHEAVEQHPWLISTHRSQTHATSYVIHDVEYTTPTNAVVNATISFDLRGRERPFSAQYHLRLTLRDKWYIDDIWYLNAYGMPGQNVIDTLRGTYF